jgi:hypothetical protein
VGGCVKETTEVWQGHLVVAGIAQRREETPSIAAQTPSPWVEVTGAHASLRRNYAEHSWTRTPSPAQVVPRFLRTARTDHDSDATPPVREPATRADRARHLNRPGGITGEVRLSCARARVESILTRGILSITMSPVLDVIR